MTRIETTLRGIFREIIVLYGTPYKEYLSARHTKKYLYTLGIINDIVNHIQEYQSEHGTLLLFRYQRFVAKNNPARRHAVCLRKNRNIHRPFFHRRVPRYFGDPVEKLLPPHQRSNDRGLTNLLVGDVKQSIYRWRNSDWELLNEKLPDYFSEEELHDETLDTNWRSEKEVVRFQQHFFFDRASARLQQILNENLPVPLQDDENLCRKIELAYRNAAQKNGKEKTAEGGYVEIDFFENTQENEDESRARDKAMNRTAEILRDLQDRGVALRDIAILVRTKEEGNRIVQYY